MASFAYETIVCLGHVPESRTNELRRYRMLTVRTRHTYSSPNRHYILYTQTRTPSAAHFAFNHKYFHDGVVVVFFFFVDVVVFFFYTFLVAQCQFAFCCCRCCLCCYDYYCCSSYIEFFFRCCFGVSVELSNLYFSCSFLVWTLWWTSAMCERFILWRANVLCGTSQRHPHHVDGSSLSLSR